MPFGPKMRVEYDSFGVILRPFGMEDLPYVADGFSSMKVLMYTKQLFAQTLENEEEWYKQVSKKDGHEVVWAIVPDGSEIPVGVTGIHGLKVGSHTCTTGIVIWDEHWWKRGVTTRAHLARTLYALDYLGMFIMESSVRVDNESSRKALQRVGYMVTGSRLRTAYRAGRYLDTDSLTLFSPGKICVLYPEGLPMEYQAGVERARIALEKARQVVKFL